MFKNLSILEVKGAEDRLYRFECDPNSPLGEVHDALCSLRSFVLDQMNAQDQDRPAESEKKCDSPQECEEVEKEALV